MSEIMTGDRAVCVFGNDMTVDIKRFVTVDIEPEQVNVDIDVRALREFFAQEAADRAATNDTREDIERWLRKAS